MNKSTEIDKLAQALNNAQKIITGAAKSKTNPHFKSHYADLENVWEAVRGPLTENGLSLVQSISEGKIVNLLMHTSGQWIETSTELKCKDPNDPQKIMASFTYFRRGTLAGISGCPQVDDDGNSAAIKQEENNEQPQQQNQFWKPKSQAVAHAAQGAEEYIFNFGKYKGQSLTQVGKIDTENYLNFLYDKAKKEGKQINKSVKDLNDAFNNKWSHQSSQKSQQDNEPPMTAYDEEIPF